MKYIATFYSHFGAIRYKKLCEGRNQEAQIMPVPRDLSSSCGTCVRYEGDLILPDAACHEEVEQIVQITQFGYETAYLAEEA
ncbi:MAG: DUF3343 domain-containing protein [Eubacteriales bacterium]|nr:DUF3343 domain-containing protein [Eubacteriales bacterium]